MHFIIYVVVGCDPLSRLYTSSRRSVRYGDGSRTTAAVRAIRYRDRSRVPTSAESASERSFLRCERMTDHSRHSPGVTRRQNHRARPRRHRQLATQREQSAVSIGSISRPSPARPIQRRSDTHRGSRRRVSTLDGAKTTTSTYSRTRPPVSSKRSGRRSSAPRRRASALSVESGTILIETDQFPERTRSLPRATDAFELSCEADVLERSVLAPAVIEPGAKRASAELPRANSSSRRRGRAPSRGTTQLRSSTTSSMEAVQTRSGFGHRSGRYRASLPPFSTVGAHRPAFRSISAALIAARALECQLSVAGNSRCKSHNDILKVDRATTAGRQHSVYAR